MHDKGISDYNRLHLVIIKNGLQYTVIIRQEHTASKLLRLDQIRGSARGQFLLPTEPMAKEDEYYPEAADNSHAPKREETRVGEKEEVLLAEETDIPTTAPSNFLGDEALTVTSAFKTCKQKTTK